MSPLFKHFNQPLELFTFNVETNVPKTLIKVYLASLLDQKLQISKILGFFQKTGTSFSYQLKYTFIPPTHITKSSNFEIYLSVGHQTFKTRRILCLFFTAWRSKNKLMVIRIPDFSYAIKKKFYNFIFNLEDCRILIK